jgi:hypothetical protein
VDTSSSAIFLIYSLKQSLDQNSRDHKQQITVFGGITEEGRERRERERERERRTESMSVHTLIQTERERQHNFEAICSRLPLLIYEHLHRRSVCGSALEILDEVRQ